MGRINSITCKNKDCKYHVELFEGTGMIGYSKMEHFRESIVSGDIPNPIVAKKIMDGAEIRTGGIYLCPKCKEFKTHSAYFLVENLSRSPFGTLRYDVTFPFETPVCDLCNSELIYIDNIRSSKVKCPKCGSELHTRAAGLWD